MRVLPVVVETIFLLVQVNAELMIREIDLCVGMLISTPQASRRILN